jgi:hypothetical protein
LTLPLGLTATCNDSSQIINPPVPAGWGVVNPAAGDWPPGPVGIKQSNDSLKTVYEDRTVAIGLLGDVQHQLLRNRLLIDASVQVPSPQAIADNLTELSSTSAVISKTWASYMAIGACN